VWQEITKGVCMSTDKVTVKTIDDIFEKYGYFLGLAYEDENGNLAVHEKGEVKDQLYTLIKEQVIGEDDPEESRSDFWERNNLRTQQLSRLNTLFSKDKA
jgi:hypothetical protein